MSSPPNLTHLESMALAAEINLADGHARQGLSEHSQERLSALARDSFSYEPSFPEVERRFLDALSRWTGQRYERPACYTLYSASIALDIVAKYLAGTGRVTGLVSPTFDNLPALLRLSRTRLVAVPEKRLFPHCDVEYLTGLGLEALIIVLPNNPTGSLPASRDSLMEIIRWAARQRAVLVFDLSFRMLEPALSLDFVALAEKMGASVVTIEDTGKVLSLLDSKASVISMTAGLAPALELVCSEVLLNVSALDLMLLTSLLADGPDNEVERAREIVAANRSRLRAALAPLAVPVPGHEGGISVEWLRLDAARDEIVGSCRSRGLHVLPGDRFHWGPGETAGRSHIRLALLRDLDYFERGIQRLCSAIESSRLLA